MQSFLIVINLATNLSVGEAADVYRKMPGLEGWRGRVCIEQTCEELDRSTEIAYRSVVGAGEMDLIEGKEGTAGSSLPEATAGKDPVEKILSGLKSITSMEGDVTVKYKKQKGADGSENTEIEVHVGAKVGKD